MGTLAKCGKHLLKVTIIIICSYLAACGGGGGGGADQPAPTNPAPTEPTSPTPEPQEPEPQEPETPPALEVLQMGFDGTASDIAAIVNTQQDDQPSLIMMRNVTTNTASGLAAVMPDGSLVKTTVSSDGNLETIITDASQFSFSNYTETSVLVSYLLQGESGETEELLDLSSCSAAATATTELIAGLSPSDALAVWLGWYNDARYSCIAGLLDVAITAGLSEQIANIETLAQTLQANDFALTTTAHNVISCETEPETCATVIAQYSSELVQGLRELDPHQQSVAGFFVDQDRVRLNRTEWDPLLQSE